MVTDVAVSEEDVMAARHHEKLKSEQLMGHGMYNLIPIGLSYIRNTGTEESNKELNASEFECK